MPSKNDLGRGGNGGGGARPIAKRPVSPSAKSAKKVIDPWTGKSLPSLGGRAARDRADWRKSSDWRADFPIKPSPKGPGRGVSRPKGKVKNADGTVSKPRSSTVRSAVRAQQRANKATTARYTALAKAKKKGAK